MYSGLSDTIRDVVWNSMELMRSVVFGPWVDR